MKTLVVDDSGVMRRFIVKTLKTYRPDMEIEEAKVGEKAVFLTKVTTFDLILMDWNMPYMSGLESVTKIRKNGVESIIFMVTTNAEKKQIIQAMKAGVNDYIIKPFTPETLIEKIEKHFPAPEKQIPNESQATPSIITEPSSLSPEVD